MKQTRFKTDPKMVTLWCKNNHFEHFWVQFWIVFVSFCGAKVTILSTFGVKAQKVRVPRAQRCPRTEPKSMLLGWIPRRWDGRMIFGWIFEACGGPFCTLRRCTRCPATVHKIMIFGWIFQARGGPVCVLKKWSFWALLGSVLSGNGTIYFSMEFWGAWRTDLRLLTVHGCALLCTVVHCCALSTDASKKVCTVKYYYNNLLIL